MRHHSTPAYDDYAGWLSLMQHYGLPTRLLDSDPRMQMQQGAFTVHGHRVPLCEHPQTTTWLQKAVVAGIQLLR